MQAGEVKLGKVFANDHQNVIPLFQRPYVWSESNWLPLWRDVRKAAEEVEQQSAEPDDEGPVETYFLGAVVVQQRRRPPRRLASSHIIDGQQRMTTLQVLLAAARAAAEGMGAGSTAARFTGLLENRSETINAQHPEDRYKVWPLPQDRDAFFWAVRPPGDGAAPPPDPGHLLVQAREWFEQAVAEWAQAAPDPAQRVEDLHFAMEDRMQLVEISLDSGDDPQVIFEALNHRGVKLAAADLVKNLLFQTVEAQGDHAVAERLLTHGWLPLDGNEWRKDVTTGRITRALVDLLLAYWLTIQTEQDVVVEHLFADTKKWLKASGSRAAEVIADIRRHADTYQALLRLPLEDPSARCLDDMRATGTTTPWPVLLYLHANAEVPPAQRAAGAAAIESYLMRRGICAYTAKDYNRLFVTVLAAARQAPPDRAGDAVRDALARQTADSRRWPTDDELIAALLAPDVYHPPYRARLKAFLVGLENHLRGTGRTEPLPVLSRADPQLNIEHVLPQTWEPNWPLDPSADGDALARRENAVHRLGNLTLTTARLNASMSNNPWPQKRLDLRRHSLLRITTASVLAPPDGTTGWDEDRWSAAWDEARIELRGLYLVHHALLAWPRPAEAAPVAAPD